MTTMFFAQLETAHIGKKNRCIYGPNESQLFRHHHNPEFIRASPLPAEPRYREAFEVIR
jgi:hypothetical protein